MTRTEYIDPGVLEKDPTILQETRKHVGEDLDLGSLNVPSVVLYEEEWA